MTSPTCYQRVQENSKLPSGLEVAVYGRGDRYDSFILSQLGTLILFSCYISLL